MSADRKTRKERILRESDLLLVSGLAMAIAGFMASPVLGYGALLFGMVVFLAFALAASLTARPQARGRCQSCGRPLKEQDECLVCGASQITRVTEMQLVACASILLLIGVVFLSAAGAYSDTTISKVGELRESDNFRQIRIVGKVIDVPDYYPEKYDEGGMIRLLVNDGTGDIWIKIQPGVARQYIRDGIIPGFGDTVDCEGSLFVGDEGYMQIKIRDPSLFRIVEREYLPITLEDLVPPDREAFDVGQLVTVEGQIQGKFYVDGFAWILDLGDDQGRTVSIFIPDTISQMSGEMDIDSLYLSTVRVRGALEWYSNGQSWEIIPARTSDIEILEPYTGDNYAVLTVAELMANVSAYQNQYVQLDNVTVAWYYADYLFSVTDDTTFEEISVFVDYDANASAGLGVGTDMNVRGWVTFYDSNNNGMPDADEWEIKVRALSSDYALRVSEMGGGA